MILRVDPDSPLPPYEQIRSQIAGMIASGVLAREARLPTIRQLAGDLGLAGGTVARAYRELEDEGMIVTRGRHGTFVSGNGAKRPTREAERLLAETAEGFALRARQLGFGRGDALAAAERALTDFS